MHLTKENIGVSFLDQIADEPPIVAASSDARAPAHIGTWKSAHDGANVIHARIQRYLSKDFGNKSVDFAHWRNGDPRRPLLLHFLCYY